MEDIPESDDTEPRATQKVTPTKVNQSSAVTPLFFVPWLGTELIPISILFLVALLCSALRASLSASAALETPWDKNSNGKIPDRQGRFTLLIIQYICMIAAWLIIATLLMRAHTEVRLALYSFSAIVGTWLVIDAVLRWLGGKYAQSITEQFLPVINAVLDALNPIGTFFLKLAIFVGVSKAEGSNPQTVELEKEDSDAIEEKELVLGVAAMGKTTAREAMVSKTNVKAFSIGINFHELMDLVNKFGYSRVPVYRHNLDSIEGILYIKDLLPYIQQNENFAWQKLIRKPYIIPETKRLDTLLDDFQQKRVHMAIVIDEYGSTKGLITLEDIIEEIFGDINDEHDDENATNFVKLDTNNYVFEGQALLNDVIRALDLESDYFADARSESETLAGIIIELFSRFPRHGEQVSFRDLTFRIQSADKKQIKKVRVIIG